MADRAAYDAARAAARNVRRERDLAAVLHIPIAVAKAGVTRLDDATRAASRGAMGDYAGEPTGHAILGGGKRLIGEGGSSNGSCGN